MARSRGLKWTAEQTKVLARLKSSGLKWQEIASRISTQFREQAKNGDQCRMRWDTLVKVYNSFEGHCRNTGRAHTDLTQEEIQNLNKATKATAYNAEWYSIVKEVCDRRPQAGMATEPSNTRSVSDPLQVRSPPRNIQHRGESSTQVQTNIVPMSVDRSSASHIQQYGAASIAGAMGINQPQNSFGRFELSGWGPEDANDMRSYQSMSEMKISTASVFSFEFDHIPQYGVENIAGDLDINQLEAFGSGSEIPSWRNIDMAGGISKKSLDEDWYPSDWKADIETPLESEQESDQNTERETERETEQEIELVQTNIVPMSVDRSSASHDPRFGAVNIAGAMGINRPQNSFGVFELTPWGPDDANCMRFISQIPSSNSTVMEAEVCVQSSEFIQKTDSNSDVQSVSCSQGVKSV